MGSTGLPGAVARVAAALAGLGVAGVPGHYPDAPPPYADAADAVIARTALFEADHQPVLIVVADHHHADPVNLAGVLGAMEVRAVADPVARLWTGQDPDAIAPIGHSRSMPVIIDIELARHRRIWVPAGVTGYLFPTSYAELLSITAGTAAEVGDLPGTDASRPA